MRIDIDLTTDKKEHYGIRVCDECEGESRETLFKDLDNVISLLKHDINNGKYD